MFAINKEVITKSGELVKPYLVEGEIVYCVTKSGKAIMRKLKDFDFSKKADPEKILVVEPVLPPDDSLFENDEPSGDILLPPEDNIVQIPVEKTINVKLGEITQLKPIVESIKTVALEPEVNIVPEVKKEEKPIEETRKVKINMTENKVIKNEEYI
jgi:hypothetical protein